MSRPNLLLQLLTSARVTGFGCRPTQTYPRAPGRRPKAANEGNRGLGAPLSGGAMGFGFQGPCSGDRATQMPVPILGRYGATEISPLGVGPATQAWVTIVVARDGARGRSRRNFRRLSADCVTDGVQEGWKGGALIMPEDVSCAEKRSTEVRRVMRKSC